MANLLSLNLTGIDSLRRGLEQAFSTIVVAEQAELNAIAEEIKTESQLQVPKDTRSLANSIFVEEEVTLDGLRTRIGYGGANAQINPKTGEATTEYMIAVHEDLNVYHPAGKAKFLEDPVNAMQGEFQARLGRHIL